GGSDGGNDGGQGGAGQGGEAGSTSAGSSGQAGAGGGLAGSGGAGGLSGAGGAGDAGTGGETSRAGGPLEPIVEVENTASNSDEGCGCRFAGRSAANGAWAGLGLVLAWARRRRPSAMTS
ncbi:MAG: MYXO-CTERM sorting domain-containing protein, partial [Myxococcales bacterium]|nr:MYXO-CTERM sorting domain-containing protein [Myxococcales bacterium]